jgi:hypothetical protein
VKLFDRKKGAVTVSDILLNRDAINSMRSEPRDYIDFVCDPPNLESILNFALHAPVDSFLEQNDNSLALMSSTATRLLSVPSRVLSDRLLKGGGPSSELFLRTLKEFPGTSDGVSNPVLIGHFRELFDWAVRGNRELLSTAFRGFVNVAVNHAELSGYQDIVVCLILDRCDRFALPYEEIEGYRAIARRALFWANEFLRTNSVVLCRRLHGIFAAIWQALVDRAREECVPIATDLTFVRLLTQAVFAAPLEEDMHVAFRTGVQMLSQICSVGRIFEKRGSVSSESEEGAVDEVPPTGKEVRVFLKAFAIGFYKDHNVETANWETTELTKVQRMLVEAFPVLWPGGIDYMFPLLFAERPVLSGFNRVFVERLCGLSRVRFLTFVHDHGILDRIMAFGRFSPMGWRAQEGDLDTRPMNPQVWQLAKFIATGIRRKSRELGTIRPYPTPMEYKEEYEKFSLFVIDYLLPYDTELQIQKGKNSPA